MPIANEARRLAAIVATDMVGYSRLMEFDEAGTLVRQKAIQEELIDPKVREFGGRIVKTTGDGALIEFPSAVNAVLSAVAIQREMVNREADIAEDRRIAYRIGINLGDIISEGDDIFGDGVNVASRLEGLAEPGGIFISEAVFRSVRGKLDLGFADLGPQQVKNLSEPISTFKVLLDPGDIGKIVSSRMPRNLGIGKLSAVLAVFLLIGVGAILAWGRFGQDGNLNAKILVLPFRSENGTGGTVANAATENLIRTFSRLRGLSTVPYDVSMEHKGIDVSLENLKQDLGVRYILDGSTKENVGQIEVSARVRDAREPRGGVIWQQTLEGHRDQLFDILATLKLNAAGALRVKLNSVERAIIEATPTNSPEAYLAFARADRLLNSKDFTDIGEALSLFERAINFDPKYVEARLGYAKSNFEVWRGSFNTIRYTLDALKFATDIVQAVEDEDSSNPEAISLQIRLMIQHLNQDLALSTARAAVFNNPDDPGLRNVLGLSLTATGMYDDAISEFAEYEALSPRLNSGEKGDLAWSYLRAGDSKKALSLLKTIPDQELKEQHHRVLANAHYQEGNLEAARANIDKFMTNNVWLNLMWMKPWFEIYADSGVYQSFATAMLAAGLPEWPYNYHEGREASRVLHDDLLVLYSDNFEERHSTGPFGAPYREERNIDGTFAMVFAWMNGVILTGTWYIKGDQFCHRIPAVHQGREQCNNVYIDKDRSTESLKFISNLYSFGVFDSEFRRLEE